jgi:hypothetical protein
VQAAAPASPSSSEAGWGCWDVWLGIDALNLCEGLTDVAALADDDVWAVGISDRDWPYGSSVILHWTGSDWTRLDLAAGGRLSAIDLSSADEGWAVGNRGSVQLFYHWNGTDWSLVPGPPGGRDYVYDVDSLSATDAWAAGLQMLAHWDGIAWSLVTNPANRPLHAIDAVATDDVWAVGKEVVLHWDGAAWSEVPTPLLPLRSGEAPLPIPPPPPDVLYDLDMLSATDGWAVGTKAISPSEGWLLRWNGAAWVEAGNLPPVYAVDVLSTDDVWAAGAELWHWVGGQWMTVTLPAAYNVVDSLDMVTPTEGWAVGGNGTILRWQTDRWQAVTGPAFSVNQWEGNVVALGAVAGSDYEGWAAGGGGWLTSDLKRVYHWLGDEWQPVSMLTGGVVQAIDIVSANDSWAIANESAFASESGWAAFLHWDGGQWLTATQPMPGVTLYGLDMLSATEGWAVGVEPDSTGLIGQPALFHWDGVTWTLAPVPVNRGRFLDIEMLSAGDGWIAGEEWTLGGLQQPLLLRWNGAAWTQVPLLGLSDAGLVELGFASAVDGWAIGRSSNPSRDFLLRWDGSEWRTAQYLYSSTINPSLDLASSTVGWLANGISGMYQLQCGTWVPARSSAYLVWDVAVVSELEGWAIGDGHLLHYKVDQVPEFVCMYFPFLAFTY